MKYKGTLISEASGSVGGLTASHNKGGYYFRQRVVPVNPGSTLQNRIRTYFSQLAIAWRNDLTPSQREGWENLAQETPVTNALGAEIHIGGNAMYIRNNTPRLQAELDRIDDAPAFGGLISAGNVEVDSFDAVNQQVDLDFSQGSAWSADTGGALLVYASGGKSPSINFYKGPYRFAGSILGVTGTPPTSPATIDLPYPIVAGQRVFFRVRAVSADGRISDDSRFLGDVA